VLAAIVVGFFLTVAGLVVGAGSLVARFHRARGVERQQLRWLALAAALTGVAAAVVGAGTAMDATAVPLFAAGVCLVLLPLATGAAILRYRLSDLDRVVVAPGSGRRLPRPPRRRRRPGSSVAVGSLVLLVV
jgi:hypothetical protein